MNKHKKKCNELKKIRKILADKLGLDLHQKECTFDGDCKGTCPKCEAEEKALNKAIKTKGIRFQPRGDLDDIDENFDGLDFDDFAVESPDSGHYSKSMPRTLGLVESGKNSKIVPINLGYDDYDELEGIDEPDDGYDELEGIEEYDGEIEDPLDGILDGPEEYEGELNLDTLMGKIKDPDETE